MKDGNCVEQKAPVMSVGYKVVMVNLGLMIIPLVV